MMSPMEAYLRLLPPRTLMHWTLRAPELSATSNTVLIESRTSLILRLGLCLSRPFQDSTHPPALVPTQGPTLHDHHSIPYLTLVFLVVSLHAAPTLKIF